MQRWWDDVESSRAALALVDSSDPQRGMGVAVLGFHGIAKAALVPLTQTTLVDASALTDALASADYADVEAAIADATGADLSEMAASRYGQLVVADMRQRTIDATVRLSRTLVNKGMPWPRAITRAAEVAGVPITSLGRYASQVAAPGLDALAVTDYADRALMEHARARSILEPEVVSKARVRYRAEQKEPFNEAEVNRDERGRFAEEARASEAEQAELEARRERRKKRKRSQKRRATALVPTGRKAEVSRVQQRAEVSGSNRPTHTNKPLPDRNVSSGPTGAFGLPMIHPNQMGNSSDPVTFSVPMYVFQDPYDTEAPAAGFMGSAYTEDEKNAALALIAETSMFSHVPPNKPPRLVEHRFEPGTLVIQGKTKAKDLWSGNMWHDSGITTYATYLPGVRDGVDVVFRPRGLDTEPTSIFSNKSPRDARTMLSFARAKDSTVAFRSVPENKTESSLKTDFPTLGRGPKFKEAKKIQDDLDVVLVINVDSEMVDREEHWDEVLRDFGKAARVRYRAVQREPWNESDVNRDELGRFAEEERATEAEAAALADRKARRKKRRRSQDRRAKVEAANRAEAESRKTNDSRVTSRAVMDRRTGRLVESRVAGREVAEAKTSATQFTGVQAPITLKVRGHQAHQAKAWMRDKLTGRGDDLYYIGSRDPLMHDDLGLVRELTFPGERASLATQATRLYDERTRLAPLGADQADMLLMDAYDLPSFPEVRVLHALHQFSKDLAGARPSHGTTWFGKHPVSDEVQQIMRRGGLAFNSFLNDPRQRADARVLPTTDQWSQAVYDQNILHSRNYVVARNLGPNGPKNEVYAGTAVFDSPTAVIIISKKAASVLERLQHITDPENEMPKRGDTAFQKAMRTLRQNEVVIEKMPVDLLEDLADEALSRPDTSEVRLDAVDVFRVYVNDERN